MHFTDALGKLQLAVAFASAYPGTYYLRLFKNNVTVNHSTVIGDLTEANFPSYSEQFVAPVSPTGLDGSYNFVYDWGSYTFTMVGSSPTNTLYGWYIYDSDNSEVVVAENFVTPLPFTISGAAVTINLNLAFNNNPAP